VAVERVYPKLIVWLFRTGGIPVQLPARLECLFELSLLKGVSLSKVVSLSLAFLMSLVKRAKEDEYRRIWDAGDRQPSTSRRSGYPPGLVFPPIAFDERAAGSVRSSLFRPTSN